MKTSDASISRISLAVKKTLHEPTFDLENPNCCSRLMPRNKDTNECATRRSTKFKGHYIFKQDAMTLSESFFLPTTETSSWRLHLCEAAKALKPRQTLYPLPQFSNMFLHCLLRSPLARNRWFFLLFCHGAKKKHWIGLKVRYPFSERCSKCDRQSKTCMPFGSFL